MGTQETFPVQQETKSEEKRKKKLVKTYKIIELSPSTSEITLIMNGLKIKCYLKTKFVRLAKKNLSICRFK